MTDFDALNDELEGDSLGWYNRVWGEAFALKEWYVLQYPRAAEPVRAEVGDEVWLFVCTDGRQLNRLAADMELLDDSGQALAVTMSPEKALPWLLSWRTHGVYGVRFNDAGRGWAVSLDDLESTWHSFQGEVSGDVEVEFEAALDQGECRDILLQHLTMTSSDCKADTVTLDPDPENSDNEYVYFYVKDKNGDILDYYCVDREDGAVLCYDYDKEEWEPVS